MPSPIPRRMLLLATVLPACPAARAEPPPTLDALMAALAAHPRHRARFTETKHLAAIEGALTSTGQLSVSPGRLEKVTDWPQSERLEVTGDRLVLTEGNDPPRVIDLNDAPPLRVLIEAIRGPLTGDAAALRQAFTTRTGGTLDDWTLTLVPRDPGAARLIRTVRLRGHDGELDRLTIVQANGDEQDMTIRPE